MISWKRKIYQNKKGAPLISLPVEFKGYIGKTVELRLIGTNKLEIIFEEEEEKRQE
ncbi:MAG: hypothetical protein QXN57_03230 [Desulfurococcaceae archaeon]